VEDAWSNTHSGNGEYMPSEHDGSQLQVDSREAPAPCEACAKLARVCSAPIRLEILRLLAAGPANVTALAIALDLDVAHVSHNLAPLREAGLAAVHNEGKRHVYALGPRATVCRNARRSFLRLEAQGGSAVICLQLADANGHVPGEGAF
jgi:DNA-binding transcriptional ArsR family regulator